MKAQLTILGTLLLVLVVGCRNPSTTSNSEIDGRAKIGVYDSRSIAIAFAGSPAHKSSLAELRSRHESAIREGDSELAAELEEEGRNRQVIAHQQAFSTAPVDALLAHVAEEMEQVRVTQDLVAVVSKWDREALAMFPSAEAVDVTMQLVDAFQPTERQRRAALQIREHKPISLDAARKIRD